MASSRVVRLMFCLGLCSEQLLTKRHLDSASLPMPAVKAKMGSGRAPVLYSAWRTARVASRPSITGICRSIRTRSGRWETTFSTAILLLLGNLQLDTGILKISSYQQDVVLGIFSQKHARTLFARALRFPRVELRRPRVRRSPGWPSRRGARTAPPDRRYFPSPIR